MCGFLRVYVIIEQLQTLLIDWHSYSSRH